MVIEILLPLKSMFFAPTNVLRGCIVIPNLRGPGEFTVTNEGIKVVAVVVMVTGMYCGYDISFLCAFPSFEFVVCCFGQLAGVVEQRIGFCDERDGG